MIACIPVFALQAKYWIHPDKCKLTNVFELFVIVCCFEFFLRLFKFRFHLASFDGCPTSDSICINPGFQCNLFVSGDVIIQALLNCHHRKTQHPPEVKAGCWHKNDVRFIQDVSPSVSEILVFVPFGQSAYVVFTCVFLCTCLLRTCCPSWISNLVFFAMQFLMHSSLQLALVYWVLGAPHSTLTSHAWGSCKRQTVNAVFEHLHMMDLWYLLK